MPVILALSYKYDTLMTSSDGRGMVVLGRRETESYPPAITYEHQSQLIPGTVLFFQPMQGESKLLGVVYEATGSEAKYWPLRFTLYATTTIPNCMTMMMKMVFDYTSTDMQGVTPATAKQQVYVHNRPPEERTIELGYMKVDAEPRHKPTLAYIPGLVTPVIDCEHILSGALEECLLN
jgi:hypothetical protein